MGSEVRYPPSTVPADRIGIRFAASNKADRRDLKRKVLVHDGHLAAIYSWHGDKWIRLHKLVWCGDVATVVSSYDITVVVVEASWSPPRWMKDSTMRKLAKAQARHVRS